MLEDININSIGGISKASISFEEGLNVVTGESGAGKSSLVRAMELICGKRSQISMIRSGSDEASVQAFFCVDSIPADRLQGFDDPEELEAIQPIERSLYISRTLSRFGRAKAGVQGRQLPLNELSSVANTLLSIQSQFAQLELLSPNQQLEILDWFGGVEAKDLRFDIGRLVQSIVENERQLRLLKQREQEILGTYEKSDRVLLMLEKMDITPTMEQDLERELSALNDEIRRLREIKNITLTLVNPDGDGLISQLHDALERLGQYLPQETEEKVKLFMENAVFSLETLEALLKNEQGLDGVADLEEEMERLEANLGTLRRAKREAKVESLEDLMEYVDKARDEVSWLRESAKRQSSLQGLINEQKTEAVNKAMNLRRLRQSSAVRLGETITRHLADMDMDKIRFIVQVVENNKLKSTGTESVEFLLQRPSGEAVPVAKGASGGELSRILLAIQLALPIELMPPTLVFDEVEAGLGGRAAYLAGLKLRELADKLQVILITHEASIATMADNHILVTRDGNVSSFRQLVSQEEKEREIARMLSGIDDSPEALSHARVLLARQAGNGNALNHD